MTENKQTVQKYMEGFAAGNHEQIFIMPLYPVKKRLTRKLKMMRLKAIRISTLPVILKRTMLLWPKAACRVEEKTASSLMHSFATFSRCKMVK